MQSPRGGGAPPQHSDDELVNYKQANQRLTTELQAVTAERDMLSEKYDGALAQIDELQVQLRAQLAASEWSQNAEQTVESLRREIQWFQDTLQWKEEENVNLNNIIVEGQRNLCQQLEELERTRQALIERELQLKAKDDEIMLMVEKLRSGDPGLDSMAAVARERGEEIAHSLERLRQAELEISEFRHCKLTLEHALNEANTRQSQLTEELQNIREKKHTVVTREEIHRCFKVKKSGQKEEVTMTELMASTDAEELRSALLQKTAELETCDRQLQVLQSQANQRQRLQEGAQQDAEELDRLRAAIAQRNQEADGWDRKVQQLQNQLIQKDRSAAEYKTRLQQALSQLEAKTSTSKGDDKQVKKRNQELESEVQRLRSQVKVLQEEVDRNRTQGGRELETLRSERGAAVEKNKVLEGKLRSCETSLALAQGKLEGYCEDNKHLLERIEHMQLQLKETTRMDRKGTSTNDDKIERLVVAVEAQTEEIRRLKTRSVDLETKLHMRANYEAQLQESRKECEKLVSQLTRAELLRKETEGVQRADILKRDTTIAALQDELARLRAATAAHEARVQKVFDLEAQLRSLTREHEEMKNNMKFLTNELQTARNQLAQAEATSRQAQVDRKAVERKLQVSEEEVQNKSSVVQELRARVKVDEVKIKDLQEGKDTMSRQLESKESEVRLLSKQLAQLNERCDHLNAQLLQQELTSRDVSVHVNTIEVKTKEISRLEEELRIIKRSIQEKSGSHKEKEGEAKRLQGLYEDMKKENQDLRKKLDGAQDQVSTLERNSAKVGATEGRLQEQVKELQAKVRELETAEKGLHIKIGTLEEKERELNRVQLQLEKVQSESLRFNMERTSDVTLKLETNLKEKEKRVSFLSEENITLKATIASLETKLRSSEEKISHMALKGSALEAMQKEIESLNDQLAAEEKLRRSQSEELRVLQQQQESEARQNEMDKSDLQSAITTIRELQGKNADLKGQLQAQALNLVRVESESKSLSSAKATLQSQMESMTQRLHQAEDRDRDLQRRCGMYEGQEAKVKMLEKEVEELNRVVQSGEAARRDGEKQIARMTQRLADYKEEQGKFSDSLPFLQEQVKGLETRLREAEGAKSQLSIDLSAKSGEVSRLEEQVAHLKEGNTKLSSQLATVEEKSRSGTWDLERASTSMSTIKREAEKEVEISRAKIQKYELEIESLRRDLEQLKSCREQLQLAKEELQVKKMEIVKLEGDLKTTANSVASLQEQVNKLKAQLREAEDRERQSVQRISQLEGRDRDATRLESELAELRTTMKEKDAAFRSQEMESTKLSQQVTSLGAENDRVSERFDAWKADMQSAKEADETKLRDLLVSLHGKEFEISRLQKEAQLIKEHNEHVNAQLADSEAACRKLSQTKIELVTKCEGLERLVAELTQSKREMEALLGERTKLKEKVGLLEGQVQGLDARLRDAEESRARLSSDVNAREAEVRRLEEQIAYFKETHEQLTAQLAVSEEKERHASFEMKRLEAALSALQSESEEKLMAARAETEKSVMEVQQKGRDLEEMRSSQAALQGQVKQLREEAQATKLETIRLETELRSEVSSTTTLTERISTLTQQLEDSEERTRQADKKLTELEGRDRDAIRFESEVVRMRSAMDEKDSVLRNMEMESIKLSHQVTSFNQENERLSANYSSLQQEVKAERDAAEAKLIQCETANRTLTGDLGAKESELSRKEGEISRLSKEIQVVKEDSKKITTQVQKVEEECRRLSEAKTELTAKCVGFERLVAELTEAKQALETTSRKQELDWKKQMEEEVRKGEKLKQDLETATNNSLALQKEIVELKAKLQGQALNLVQLEGEARASEATRDSMRDELDRVNQELQLASKREHGLQERLSAFDQRERELQRQLGLFEGQESKVQRLEKEIENMSRNIQTAETSLRESEKEASRLSQEVSYLRGQKQEAIEQAQSLQDRLAHTDAEREHVSAALGAMETQVQRLEEFVGSKSEECRQLSTQLATAEEKGSALQQSMIVLRREYEEKSASAEARSQRDTLEIETLRRDLESAQSSVKTFHAQTRQLEDSMQAKKLELVTLEAELKSALANSTTFEGQVNKLTQQQKDAEERERQGTQRLSQLEARDWDAKRLESELATLRPSFEEKTRKLQASKKDVVQLKDELQARKLEIVKIEGELRAAASNASGLQEQASKLAQQREEAEQRTREAIQRATQLEMRDREATRFETELANLRPSVEEKDAKLRSQETEAMKLTQQVKSLTSENERFTSRQTTLQEQVTRMTQQLQEAEERGRQATQKAAEQEHVAARLESELSALRPALEEKDTALRAREVEVAKLVQQVASYTKESERFTALQADLKAAHEADKAKLKELETANRSLTGDLRAKETELSRMSQDAQHMTERIERLTITSEENATKLRNQELEASNLAHQVKSHSALQQELKAAQEAAEGKIKELQMANRSLTQDLSSSKAELSGLQQRIQTLTQGNQQLAEAAEEKDVALRNREVESAKLAQQVASLAAEIERVSEIYSAWKKEMQVAKEADQAAIVKLEEVNRTLTGDLRTKDGELARLQNQVEVLQETSTQSKNQLQQAEDEGRRLSESRAELTAKCVGSERLVKELQVTKQGLEESGRKLTMDLEVATSNVKAAEKENAGLKAQLQEQALELVRLQGEARAAETAKASLSNELERVAHELPKAEERERELQRRVGMFEGQESKVVHLEREIEELHQNVSAMETSRRDNEKENSRLTQQLSEVMENRESLKAQVAAQGEQVQILEVKLRDVEQMQSSSAAAVLAREAEIRRLEGQLSDFKEDHKKLSAQLTTAEETGRSALSKVEVLQSSLTTVQREMDEKLDAARTKAQSDELELDRLKRDLETARSSLLPLEDKNAQLKEDLQTKNLESIKLEGEVRTAMDKISSLKAENDRLSEQQKQAEQEWRQTAKRLGQLEARDREADRLETELATLRPVMDEKDTKLRTHELESVKLTQQVKSLTSENERFTSRHSAIQEQVASLTQQLRDAEERARQQAQTVSQHEREVTRLESELSSMRPDLEDKEKKIRAQETETVKLEQLVKSLTSENQTTKDKLARAETDLKAVNEASQAKIQQCEETIRSLTGDMRAKDGELSRFQHEVQVISESKEQIASKLQAAEDENRKLAESRSELVAKCVGSERLVTELTTAKQGLEDAARKQEAEWNRRYQDALDQGKQNLQAEAQRAERVSRDLEASSASVMAMQKEIAELKSQLHERDLKAVRTEGDMKTAEASMASLRRELERATQELHETEQRERELQRHCGMFEGQESKVQRLEREIDELNRIIQDGETSHRNSEKENARQKQELQDVMAEKERLTSKMSMHQEQLQGMQNRLRDAEEMKGRLSSDVSSRDAEVRRLEEQIAYLKEGNQRVANQLSTAEEKGRDTLMKTEMLQSSLATLKREAEEKAEAGRAKAQKDEMEIEVLRRDLAEARSAVKPFQDQNSQLKEDIHAGKLQVMKLEGDLRSAVSSESNYKEQCTKLTGQIQGLEEKGRQAAERVQALEARDREATRLDSELATLHTSLEEKDAKFRAMEGETLRLSQAVTALTDENDLLTEKLVRWQQDMKAVIAEGKQHLEEANLRAEGTSRDLELASTNTMAMQKEITELKAQLHEKDLEAVRAEELRGRLSSESSSRDGEVRRLEEQLGVLKEENLKLSSQLSTAEEQGRGATMRSERLEAEVQSVTQQLEKANAKAQEAEAELRGLTRTSVEFSGKNEILERLVSEAQRSKEQAEENARKREVEIQQRQADAEKQVATIKAEMEVLQKDNRDLKAQLQEHSLNEVRVEGQIRSSEASRETLKSDLSRVSQELQEVEARERELQRRLGAHEGQQGIIQRLEKEVAQLNKTIEDGEASMRKSAKDMAKQAQQVTEMSKEKEKLIRKATEAQGRVKALELQMREAADVKSQQSAEIRANQAEVKRLEEQVEYLKNQLADAEGQKRETIHLEMEVTRLTNEVEELLEVKRDYHGAVQAREVQNRAFQDLEAELQASKKVAKDLEATNQELIESKCRDLEELQKHVADANQQLQEQFQLAQNKATQGSAEASRLRAELERVKAEKQRLSVELAMEDMQASARKYGQELLEQGVIQKADATIRQYSLYAASISRHLGATKYSEMEMQEKDAIIKRLEEQLRQGAFDRQEWVAKQAQLENKVQQHQARETELESELKAMIQRNEELLRSQEEHQLGELRQVRLENGQLAEALRHSQDNLFDVEADLQRQRVEFGELQNQIKQLKQQVSDAEQLKLKIEDLQRTNAKVLRERNTLEGRVPELKEQLTEAEQRFAEAQREARNSIRLAAVMELKEEEIRRLQAELGKLTALQEKADTDRHECILDLTRMTERCQNLESVHPTLKEELATGRAKIQTLTDENVKLSLQAGRAGDVERLAEEQSRTIVELQTRSKEIPTLQGQITNLQKSLEEARNAARIPEGAGEKDKEMARMKEEITRLTTQKDGVAKSLSTVEAKLSEREAELREAQKEGRELARVSGTLEARKEEITRLSQQLEKAKAELDDRNKTLKERELALASLTSTHKNMEDQFHHRGAELERLLRQVEGLKHELSAHDSALAAGSKYQQDNNELQRMIVTLTSENHSMAEALQTSQQNLNELEDTHQRTLERLEEIGTLKANLEVSNGEVRKLTEKLSQSSKSEKDLLDALHQKDLALVTAEARQVANADKLEGMEAELRRLQSDLKDSQAKHQPLVDENKKLRDAQNKGIEMAHLNQVLEGKEEELQKVRQKLSKLQADFGAVQSSSQEKDISLATLTTKMGAVEKQLQQSVGDVETRDKQISELRGQISELEVTKAKALALEADNKQLQERYAKADARGERFQTQLDELRAKLEEAQKEGKKAEHLAGALEGKQADIKRQDATLKDLQNQLQAAISERQEKEGTIMSLRSEVDNLRREVSLAQGASQGKKDEALQQQLTMLKAEMAAQAQERGSEVARLSGSLEARMDEAKRMRDELAKVRADYTAVQSTCQEKEVALATLTSNHAALQDKLQQGAKDLEKQKLDVQDLQDQLKTADKERRDKEKVMSSMQAEVDGLKSDLDAARGVSQEKEVAMASLSAKQILIEEQLAHRSHEVIDRNEQLGLLRKEVAQLEETSRALDLEKSKLQIQTESYGVAVKASQEAKDTLSQTLEALKQDHVSVVEAKELAEKNHAQLEGEMRQASKAYLESTELFKEEIAALNETIQKKNKEAAKMDQQVATLMTELDARAPPDTEDRGTQTNDSMKLEMEALKVELAKSEQRARNYQEQMQMDSSKSEHRFQSLQEQMEARIAAFKNTEAEMQRELLVHDSELQLMRGSAEEWRMKSEASAAKIATMEEEMVAKQYYDNMLQEYNGLHSEYTAVCQKLEQYQANEASAASGKKKKKKWFPYFGMECADHVTFNKKYGGRQEYGEIKVVRVWGPAMEAGVETLDFIRFANGQAVGSLAEFRDAISTVQPNDMVVLGVERNSKIIECEVYPISSAEAPGRYKYREKVQALYRAPTREGTGGTISMTVRAESSRNMASQNIYESSSEVRRAATENVSSSRYSQELVEDQISPRSMGSHDSDTLEELEEFLGL